ncbi:MAG: hypothetical protein ACRERU_14910 [Methylococcales bacterium]
MNSPPTISDANGAQIIISDYQAGDFGIVLKDAFADPLQTLLGDLAYQDFDPVAPGIQTRTDASCNVITVPGNFQVQEDELHGTNSAMASFNPPPPGELTLAGPLEEQLAPVLAASWT